MDISRAAASFFAVLLVASLSPGGQVAEAQQVRFDAGGGWAVPSSSVNMTGISESEVDSLDGLSVGPLSVDTKSGAHAYAALGLQWRLSSNFDLGIRVRVQQVEMEGDASDLTSPLVGCTLEDVECSVSGDPEGRIRSASFEGRLVLTSTGRIRPYFLVGLGVVRTTMDGVRVVVPESSQTPADIPIEFDEVSVTDAGGDVGFGAYYRLVGNLDLLGELRATGSLPGAKENAVTTFPFTLGLSYEF